MTPATETTRRLASVAYAILDAGGKTSGQGPTLRDVSEAIATGADSLKIRSEATQKRAGHVLMREHGWADRVIVKNTRANREAGLRMSETDVANVVIKILGNRPGHTATFAELIDLIPREMVLSRADLVRSKSRPNEAVWQQQVRNIVSHQNAPGNAIYEGTLVHVKGGLALPKRTRLR